jgi:SAM-dependent methyltransferase
MLGNAIRSVYLRLRSLRKKHRIYSDLSLPETFRRIYNTKAWGDEGERFHSGAGSRGQIAEHYCSSVIRFIQEHRVRSVVDLGCGDFSVGSVIQKATGVRYVGIDVVPELIEHLTNTVQSPLISFDCLDITRDLLPQADLCLIRQVLQHLSNQEIDQILRNLGGFSSVLISEQVPAYPQSINHDKPHGPDVRGIYGSGVYVEKPPFSIEVEELWSFPLKKNSMLRTVLFRQTGPKMTEAIA